MREVAVLKMSSGPALSKMWAPHAHGPHKIFSGGYAPTREAAMSAFAKSWRREAGTKSAEEIVRYFSVIARDVNPQRSRIVVSMPVLRLPN